MQPVASRGRNSHISWKRAHKFTQRLQTQHLPPSSDHRRGGRWAAVAVLWGVVRLAVHLQVHVCTLSVPALGGAPPLQINQQMLGG